MKPPPYQDLSPEQDSILNLPLDESHLITGAPGTGKSIMALYRAQALAIDDREPLILTYSNLLNQYTITAAKELGLDDRVTTYHRWFREYWRATYGAHPPTMADHEWAYDWTAIARRFVAQPPPARSVPDLILDEGQDLPLGFYRLASYLARTITVFADEHQQIHDEQCTLSDIRSAIGVSRHHEMRYNSRNTREIMRLANHFYPGSVSRESHLPRRAGPLPTLRRFADLDDFTSHVARYARAHPHLRIGIACRFTRQQVAVLRRLRTLAPRASVRTYVSGDRNFSTVDFDDAGTMIVNYASLKGLEFDTLFVPDLQQISGDVTSASIRMLFYVITSRARHECHLSWCGQGPEPPIIRDVSHSALRRLPGHP